MSAEGTPVTPAELASVTRILEAIAGDSLLLSQLSSEERIRLLVAAGRVIRPEKLEVRRRLRAGRRAKWDAKRAADRALRAATSMRVARKDSVFVPAPRLAELEGAPGPVLSTAHACYICKALYTKLHHFYDSMCPTCASFNYNKRFQAQSMPGVLKGTVALITGGRLKIGYQAVLMMLQAGARVIVTTRFPKDAAARFAREPGFREWRDRLEVHGLDLRHAPSVEAFAQFITETHERLDFLINNAAQTVRRPPGFYAHLLEGERASFESLSSEVQGILEPHERFKHRLEGRAGESLKQSEEGTRWIGEWHKRDRSPAPGVTNAAELSQIPYTCDGGEAGPEQFPAGRLDADLQQLDLRAVNTWRLTLDQVSTSELLEVQLVNSIAPYVLCGKLKPLMMRTPGSAKHVVNVSAMEGKFSRHTKTDKHPHTNMAKAALNMMTLTSARDYMRFGIYMNAVDTGWVTDEDPAQISQRKEQEHDFQPPLDIVDGAARVLDPIFSGLQTGKHSWGNFLKDYVPTEW